MRERLKSGLHRLFVIGQRAGWDILPRHFYSNIPDMRALQSNDSWKKPFELMGIAGTDIESQVRFVEECCMPIQERLQRGGIHEHACRENGESGYGYVEAEFLFSFVTAKRPKRIVQTGCGVSTAVILLAAKEAGYEPEVTCIDPFPTAYLRRLGENKQVQLIPEGAQHVKLETLTNLDAGDLLFIDSTHAARPGSEVNRIILDVLPRLRSGVFVHFHDIHFPYDYPPNLMTTLFFFGESPLLQAFLTNNSQYRIAASFSMLHHACAGRIRAIMPNYKPAQMHYGLYVTHEGDGHFPSSTYLRVL